MPKFTTEQVLETMQQPKNIRNISIIAHVDHGKTTLTDSLLKMSGLMADKHAGDPNKGRVTDTHNLESLMGITIQSTAVSLYYNGSLVNLIDSPGHVDFSSEVTAALRLTDGAIVVVDCLEGVCVQTQTVLRQALLERVKPVLFLNKLDRIFLETKPKLEDAYITLRNTIESVDVICQTYGDSKLGEIRLSPELGNVGFGSGLHGWGFTLHHFERMYASRFSTVKIMKKLWGNHYYDAKNDKWLKENKTKDGRVLERAFVTFVLRPIRILCDAIMDDKKEVFEPIIESLRLKFTKQQLSDIKKPKDYLKLVMSQWLSCGDTLLEMTMEHLPSPIDAQKYRVDCLYNGDLSSPAANDIRECNVNGEFSMYVSKMIPVGVTGKFLAFGRVFSGKISKQQTVRVMRPDYVSAFASSNENSEEEEEKVMTSSSSSSKNIKGLSVKKVQSVYLMMAKDMQSIPYCYAGNLCAVAGLDGNDGLIKSGTLGGSDKVEAFKTMKFSVSPVVQYAVKVANPKDLPKLLEGLKKLERVDPLLVVSTSNNENIIAGAGELHLNICLERLKDDFMKGIKVIKSEPIVSLRESISGYTKCALKTDKQEPNLIVSKSPNNLNRLYMTAKPLSESLCNDIENGLIDFSQLNKNIKSFSKQLHSNEEYKFDKFESQKIWTFGTTDETLSNCIIDLTKGETLMKDIKPHVVNAFTQSLENGVLCGEKLRGVQFNIKYAKIHSDRSHRGAGQIEPSTRNCMYGCQLASNAILLEPMYAVEISTDLSCQNSVINCLQQRNGMYRETVFNIGTMILIKGYLPVLQSFGFTEFLREKVKFANPQMQFSHWQEMKGNPLEKGSYAYDALMKIRERKGLKMELPELKNYFDRVV